MSLETIDLPDQIDEETKRIIAKTAKAQADRFVRKNRKEIHRLIKHAENALVNDDQAAYNYAIGKIYNMTKRKIFDSELETLWHSNRQVLFNLISTEVEG